MTSKASSETVTLAIVIFPNITLHYTVKRDEAEETIQTFVATANEPGPATKEATTIGTDLGIRFSAIEFIYIQEGDIQVDLDRHPRVPKLDS